MPQSNKKRTLQHSVFHTPHTSVSNIGATTSLYNTLYHPYLYKNMTELKDWPILKFVPTELSANIKKVCVFSGSANKAIFILTNGDTYTLGFNTYECLGTSDENKLRPKKIESLCGKNITSVAYGSGPHILTATASGELYS